MTAVPVEMEKLMDALLATREAFGDTKFGFGAAFMLGLVFRDSPELISALMHVIAEGMDDQGDNKLKDPKWVSPPHTERQ